MITITRRLEFDAAHRVLGHEGKCRHLHGHRYAVELTVQAPELDPLGRVVDFGEVKRLVGGWIEENWDHNILLHPSDPLLIALRQLDEINLARPNHLLKVTSQVEVTGGREPYLLPNNPTAENLARELYAVACFLLPAPLKVKSVRVYETPSCWADYEEEK